MIDIPTCDNSVLEQLFLTEGQDNFGNKICTISMFSFSECNLPCLMTSDKNYLGEGNIDKFDGLFFKVRHFGPNYQGILFVLYQ